MQEMEAHLLDAENLSVEVRISEKRAVALAKANCRERLWPMLLFFCVALALGLPGSGLARTIGISITFAVLSWVTFVVDLALYRRCALWIDNDLVEIRSRALCRHFRGMTVVWIGEGKATGTRNINSWVLGLGDISAIKAMPEALALDEDDVDRLKTLFSLG